MPNVSFWRLENVGTLEGSFANTTLASPHIEYWNLGRVTNMKDIFYGPIGAFRTEEQGCWFRNWDTSRVTDMTNMFRASPMRPCTRYWDTSNVKCFKNMFKDYIQDFNPDVSLWNVSSGIDFTDMF